MKQDKTLTEVNQICEKHHIEFKDVKLISDFNRKKVFSIDQKFLLRVSDTPMTSEQERFDRVAALNFVPRILDMGVLETDTESIYYTFLTFLPGDDFVIGYRDTSLEQQKRLGRDLTIFLDELQTITGKHYDIGLYIPVIPHFSGSWKAGHQRYWEILEKESAKKHLSSETRHLFESAFQFLRESDAALDFQAGPRLLHNDLHPKNILLSQGIFSGVIDWECSQFGEADFELCHLVHWCIYPPDPTIDYRPFLRALFDTSPKCTQTPNLVQRLTIYQIEHEIQQMMWHGTEVELLRVPRLEHWMADGVNNLFKELQVDLTGK